MKYSLLISGYDAPDEPGISIAEFQSDDASSIVHSSIAANNASWVVKGNGHMLYAVGESGFNSSIDTFAVENNQLRAVHSLQIAGADPCHLLWSKGTLYSANYSAGSIGVYRPDAQGVIRSMVQEVVFTGSGPVPKRQQSSHIHQLSASPCGRYLFATDLGGDRIYQLRIQEDGTLVRVSSYPVGPGYGPRVLSWSPDGKMAYLLCELSGHIVVYRWNGEQLIVRQRLLTENLSGKSCADIRISHDGRFAYASARGDANTLSLFSIDANGLLKAEAVFPTLAHPRCFAISPCDGYLLCASRDANAILVFERDKETGWLTDTTRDIRASKPVCLSFE